MNALVIAPMVVVLLGIVATLVLRPWRRVQRATSLLTVLVYACSVAALAYAVVFRTDATALSYRIGGWRVPFGVTVVADALSVFMLSLAAVVAVYAVGFSVRFIRRDNQNAYYHPLFQFLLLGVTGAFLTGDLFNLFVWFEVMLMASYVFVAFYGNARHTAAATRYVVLNIVGSVLMLLAVGGLYATTGTLNMAETAVRLGEMGATEAAPVVGLSALILATFALKAGLVPFQFWVPSAYKAAPMPVAAILAGVTKKVGIYAIVRLYFTVLGNTTVSVSMPFAPVSGGSPLAFLAPVLLAMAVLSVVVGGFGALNADRLDGLLAYSSIGQVGFIAAPVAVAAGASSASLRRLGLFAAFVYSLHHALTKGLLFLSSGVVRDTAGTTRISEVGGLGQLSSPFTVVFLVGSLSLVGIPPLAGFFGKLFVFDVAVRSLVASAGTGGVAVLAVLLLGAFLTILYSTRAWSSMIWGEQTEAVADGTVDTAQVYLLASLAAVVVLVGVGFEPVYGFAEAAAEAAIDTEGYIDAVLQGGGRG